ncbi:MAG: hypothetical protein Q8R39_01605 [bacterium]|nr:hypothetical protein [bacterium]
MLTNQLFELYGAWKQQQKTSKTTSPQSFRWYVMTHAQLLYRQLQLDPPILASLPKQIQRDWRGERRQTIGPKVLKEYGSLILHLYLAESEKGTCQGTLEDFVNTVVLGECETKEDLQAFLKKFFLDKFSP